jgi:long-subunit fatty acid transport protein
MDASFTGSSTYYGIQVGATYAITEMISVAIGGRYVMANNSYEGALTNITIDAPAAYGGTQTPGDYGRVLSGIITPLNPDAGAQLAAAAAQLDAQTADKYLNATQSGSGFTPIIGVNFHLSDMINLAARYEHHTKIELTNDTEVDDVAMFPDGEKVRGDLPGMFALGAELSPLQKLKFGLSFNYFLDKGAYYGETDDVTGEQINNETTIDENAWNLAVSAEYKFLGILGVSVGYNLGNLGVNDGYQSDISYANKSTSIAGGLFVELGEIVTLNAGYIHVMYEDYTEEFQGPPVYHSTYGKATDMFAIGIDLSF